MVNLCSAALRGAGNVKTPALISLMGVVTLVPLSPLLIFGALSLPGLGIAGAGLAVTIYYSAASLLLLRYLRTGRAGLTLTMNPLRRALFRVVLGVGLISSVAVIQINLAVIIVTGTVGKRIDQFAAVACDRLRRADRLSKAALDLDLAQRFHRLERVGQPLTDLVEPPAMLGAELQGERSARHRL